jgi:hypothetical protein
VHIEMRLALVVGQLQLLRRSLLLLLLLLLL